MRAFAAVLSLSLLLGISPLAAADETVSKRDVERLFQLMQIDQMVGQMGAQMTQAMIQGAQAAGGGQSLTPEQQQIVDKYLQQMGVVMFSEQNVARLMDASLQLYLDHFTGKEVADMIRFYESETGRAMVRKMPAVMQQSMQLGLRWAQEMQPEMLQLQQQMLTELKALAEQPKP